MSVLGDLTKAVDNNFQVDTIYLDFRKAFDSVPHRRLLKEVNAYGISSPVLNWLGNFLNGRKQRVVIDGQRSEWNPDLSKIPQGSILGPILFIIFVNDIQDVVRCLFKMFADDCKIYNNILSATDQQQLQEDIDCLCQWIKDWLLKFNIKKCKFVSFGNEKFHNDYNMTDENRNVHKLVRDYSEKDLSVLFTNNLNFETHINDTVNKVNKIIGLISRKFTFMDKSFFLTLYRSLVHSLLDYGNLIYFP